MHRHRLAMKVMDEPARPGRAGRARASLTGFTVLGCGHQREPERRAGPALRVTRSGDQRLPER
jgi:hypothetical protein